MATHLPSSFLAGVIEGFYGQPWSRAERLQLFDWMAAWGLNTYLYAPKDDLKHRALWRQLYTNSEAEALRELIQECHRRGLRFIYALSPGLDLRYRDESDAGQLRQRFQQMLDLGCRHFALLFDDIPDQLDPDDWARWGSLASAQAFVANATFVWARERSTEARFLFCPTPYCGRMAARALGGEGYLATVGRELLRDIDVLWTGPEIVSRDIQVGHVQELQQILRRKPLIWDNLHANDYDGRRFYCGPYAGRPPELRTEVAGLLTNPNNEFPINYVPLRTFAQFVQCERRWDARDAYVAAMREWFPHFQTIGTPLALEDLILLGDSYYLPHQEGPEAELLHEQLQQLLSTEPARWGDSAKAFRHRARRLREFCARMAELQERPLFYALSRRVWELREELDLLEKYVAFRQGADAAEPFRSDFHLARTYRGGMVARLQRLLALREDGTVGVGEGLNPTIAAQTG